MDIEILKIVKEIDKHDIISFDIFDTLVLRNVVFPRDIFKILAQYVKVKYKIKDFYNIRINSEIKARYNTSNEDILIENIYDVIAKKCKIDCTEIMEKELELESKFIVENPFIKQIFNYAKSSGKKILFISDMYLSRRFIEPILNNMGYVGYDDIFISGEIKKTKATKTIYKFLISEYPDLKPEKWLHIGDNIISDVKNPRCFKINAYHYEAVRDRAAESDESISINTSVMKALQYNMIFTGFEISYWEKFGIQYAASVYYGFGDWIMKKKGFREEVFLLLEEYIPKDVLDMIKEKGKAKSNELKTLCSPITLEQMLSPTVVEKSESDKNIVRSNDDSGKNLTMEEIVQAEGLEVAEYADMLKLFKSFLEEQLYVSKMKTAVLKAIERFIDYDEYITGISIDSATLACRNFIMSKRYEEMVEFYNASKHVFDNNSKKRYVSKYTKDEMVNDYLRILDESSSNLWAHSFIVEGITNESEFKKFLKRNKIKRFSNSGKQRGFASRKAMVQKVFNYTNLKKGLKDPFKAIKIIIDLIFRSKN